MIDYPAHINTLNSLFDHSCEQFADLPALGFALKDTSTYREFRSRVMCCAVVLAERGVKARDKVAILAENSPQWCCAYLAIVRLGAVAVPILPDFPEADVHHIIAETGVKILFATERQIDKIYELQGKSLHLVVTLDDYASGSNFFKIVSLTDFMSEAGEETAREIESKVVGTDIASIIYTSGTSGHSKAVMLSHANFCANVRSTIHLCAGPDSSAADRPGAGWTFLSVLPLSHAYEFTTSFLLAISTGARIVYCERPPTPTILAMICRAEKPMAMSVVPVIMEKIYKKRILPVMQGKAVVRLALRVPFLRRQIMGRIGMKLQDFFGGNLRLMAIGGAALNIEVEKILTEVNFPYVAGYGLTEAAPILAAGPVGDRSIALGSCGKPVADVQISIADPDPVSGIGEIMAQGPNVMMGYYNDQLATAETIDENGWLATGDLGHLDADNNLFITGRSKSVIVLSSGENIYPETIEEKINARIEVAESLVIATNDRLMAIIYPDYEYIDAETKGDSQQDKLIYIEAFLRDIQRSVNGVLPPYGKISRVVERQEPFIKTATHKIKRYLYADAY